ncbi:MAG: sugar ABC transporter permease [Chloroflexales bacterium]|nr:sugar ABC transporter permease [Chloroflexales bacterium]
MGGRAITHAPPPRARRATLMARESRLAYAMLAPTVLIVVLIVIIPVLWTIWMSLHEVRLIDLQRTNLWSFDLTLENYATVLRGRNFWPIFRTTLIYTIGGSLLAIVGGLAAALLVHEPFPGRNIFRGFLLFPYIAPVVAVAFTWRMMLNAQFGIVNQLLDQPIDFLSQRYITLPLFGQEVRWPLALTMVILFEGWRYFPFAFLFFLARLQALPEELYEAAAVDGALPSQRFLYITLPQLWGVFATLFLLRFIWTFNKFDDIYLLTGGGAGTEIITVQIYEYLTGRNNVGAAAALAVVLALFLIILVPLYVRFVAREDAS